MEVYAEAYFGKFGIIVAFESIEIVGRTLGGAVASPKVVLEQYRNFAHRGLAVAVAVGSDLERCYEVFLAVGSHFSDRELRACDYHRLVQVSEHKRQRRCRVSHRVGAVKYHKSVVAVVVVGDTAHYGMPVLHVHIRRIDRFRKLDMIDFIIEHLDFRNVLNQMVEVEWFEGFCFRVLYHSYCTTGVHYEDSWFHGADLKDWLTYRCSRADLRCGCYHGERAVGIESRQYHAL